MFLRTKMGKSDMVNGTAQLKNKAKSLLIKTRITIMVKEVQEAALLFA